MLEFSGPVWRILFLSQCDAPLAPAKAPEGRFHFAGQTALYASLSAEGAAVAIRRYVGKDDPPRVLQQARITKARLVDLRGQRTASVVWQEMDRPSPTWQFSEAARAQGADGLIYSSRSRPDLSHLVLFKISADVIHVDAPATAWVPPYS
ncbi:RES family NAD+ phosphorylase [Ruegeria lacuscaerulensis]|uniref:RES family NAD+ phosphorylase n=1 Tax=Ruegeria lacuscaerulensis TaxID=55218 RepID=UPI00147AC87A|nr:RES family NAD+ phosphorylase [Ruegeria lacuscaerulensis]